MAEEEKETLEKEVKRLAENLKANEEAGGRDMK